MACTHRRAAAMRGADGQVAYITHLAEDVTEFIRLKQQGLEQNKETQELRSKSEKMESEIYLRAQELQETNFRLREAEKLKSEFFANISHELRTPLSLILGPAQSMLAGKNGPISDSQSQLLTTIHSNAIRLLQMINDLLDLSKSEAGKMVTDRQPTDIRQLTQAVLFDFDHSAGTYAVADRLARRYRDVVLMTPRASLGDAVPYALFSIQERGKLFVTSGDQVYDGMIVGENPRVDDLPVNPTRSKQLTNFRAAGSDKGIQLTPPVRFSLERAIEYIAPDELVEATPKNIRLRKRTLDSGMRNKEKKRLVAEFETTA